MLRSLGSKSLAVLILGVGASSFGSSAGCSITKPTELVPGALTQMQVDSTLAGIRLEVFANGARVFLSSYTPTNGKVFLPGTLGLVPQGSATTTVTVILAGYGKDEVKSSEFNDPTQDITEVGQNPGSSPKVRRGSVQSYVSEHTLFLPLSLSYSCWGNTCSNSGTQGNTCKANTCQSSNTDSTKLVDFDPSLVDGTEQCFDPTVCFTPATTAVLLDASKCLYEVPPGQVDGLGLNVRILYQDFQASKLASGEVVPDVLPTSEEEILNEEQPGELLEGFSIPDPQKPLQFLLGDGLCALVGNFTAPPQSAMPGSGSTTGPKYHAISSVQVSTTCPSKVPLLPVCASDLPPAVITGSDAGEDGGGPANIVRGQPITLDPAPSALYFVMDDASLMSGAYGPMGKATALGTQLSNPLFKRTYLAFEFLDHAQADCTAATTPYTTPGASSVPNSLDFTQASVAQPTIANFLNNWKPPADLIPGGGTAADAYPQLDLQTALGLQGGAFKRLSDFEATLGESAQIGAAIFFVNRQPDSSGSGDAGAGGMIPFGTDCTPPLGPDGGAPSTAQQAIEQEIEAANKAGLQTYFVVLNNAISGIQGTPLPYFKSIQSDVQAAGVSTMAVIDATDPTSITTAAGQFANTAVNLGTCLYELPPGVDNTATVDFTIPIPTQLTNYKAPVPVKVDYNSACNATTQATQDGWNIEGAPGTLQHLRICGTGSGACWKLRTSVLAVSAAVLTTDAGGATNVSAADIPEVPVTVTMPVDGGTP
jgi:hypothetical protein